LSISASAPKAIAKATSTGQIGPERKDFAEALSVTEQTDWLIFLVV